MAKQEDIIKNIEALIIENRLKEAINELIPIFSNADEESMVNEAILTLSRLNAFLSKSNLGVVDQFDMEYSKIRLSVLNMKSNAKKIIQLKTVQPKSFIPKPDLSAYQQPPKVQVGSQIIFEDDFINNQNHWPVGSSDISHREIKNGRYFLEHTREVHCDLYSRKVSINSKKDFSISSRMTFLDGTDNNAYGLCFGKGDNSNYFQFGISANGYFLFNYFLNNDYFKVSDWIASSAIKQGKQSNLLHIDKKGEMLHFKINNQEVYSCEFLSFFGDDLGFAVNRNMKIAVDFIRVKN